MNKVILIGNTGSDVNMKRLESGAAVAQVSLATRKSWKDKNGEYVEKTEWHRLVAWRGRAEFMERHVGKGSQIAVEGEITYREYEKEGVKRINTEIIVGNIEILVKKETAGTPVQNNNFGSSTENKVGKTDAAETVIDDDGLPF